MKYTEFVKANYDKVTNLPAKERMKKLGEMWKKSSHSVKKGGNVVGGIFIKRKLAGKKGMRKVKGKGVISDALGVKGLEMKKRKPKGKGVVGGATVGGATVGGATVGGATVGGATVGGDMSKKEKMKMVKQMHKLELINHNKKLTKLQAKKLKHLHNLDGAGFWDDVWSGIKSVGSTALDIAPHVAMAML